MVAIDDFSRMLQLIYAAAIDPHSWGDALQEISDHTGGVACALTISDQLGSAISVGSARLDGTSMAAYNDHYGIIDPIAPALLRLPVGSVVTHREVTTPEAVRHSEFFNDWAYPSGFGDCLFSVLARDTEPATWWLWLAAPAGARPDGVDSNDAVLLRALLPHLQQAIRLGGWIGDLQHRHQGLLAALDAVPHGVVLVGNDTRVVHINPAAARMVASRDGLSVHAGRLRTTAPGSDTVLAHALQCALARGDSIATGDCLAAPRPSGRRPYLLRVVPLGETTAQVGKSSGAMVVVVDPEDETEPEIATLIRVHGLTRTEARVALRVLAGTGLAPIAEELSMSMSTVRTHLQRVFDKTGTHRQAELVRLLLGGLAATRRPASR